MDDLEPRALLSTASQLAHPTFEIRPSAGGGAQTSPPYTPAELQQAYGFNSITFNGVLGTGSGQTIAIVDAYDDPNIKADLNTFDSQWGLASLTVTRVDENGGTNYPASDSTGNWELEESLDVEWAHAMAPGASIMLVEASSASYSDLFTAVNYAASHASVVSMSWAGSEFLGEANYDSNFNHAGVAFVASSGDSGAPALYPSASPNVLSVGGTTLSVLTTASNVYVWSSETGWSGSGGGPSTQESQPSYQTGVVKQQSSARATPDVAYDADPNTGVYVYDSVPYNGSYGWWQVGGTSAAAPQWSALLAIADQGRKLNGQLALNSTPNGTPNGGSSPQQVMSILYANPADFHDITSGMSTGSTNYYAGTGYDYVTGMGSPIANLVVGSLVGTSTASSDKLVVTAPPTAETAGTPFSLTVTAQNSSGTATDTSYLGTIHFTSSDVQAGLPANYTFTTGTGYDNGVHVFTVTLKTAGSQSITATDTTNAAITGTLSGISVSPAPASQFVLSGLPSTVTAGAAQTLTVTAEDPYGNVATGYTGTVQFTSSDTAASLPANYTFTTGTGYDNGVHLFTVTLNTAGPQWWVTVKDMSSSITATQSGITVAPAAPTNLTASAASSTAINLTWTSSSGATGYLVQQSLNGTTGWSAGSTTTSTTFQQTGLSAGTTYYFRVIATLGTIDSPSSKVASATTTGTAPTADSIWPNSYVPSVVSSSGAYELGVKFTASVAGYVTGVRFYKESGMSGQNVGHLWSSTGTLLATATFTNESSYGWQQVNFKSPVMITAKSVYIASFSTSGSYFGITTSYFTRGGVTNGPLYAEPNSVAGGDGVYNRPGYFPNGNGNGMNFWADVAFTPSSSGAARPALSSRGAQSIALGGFRSGTSTTDPSSRLGVLAPPATPAGPARSFAGWRGTTPATVGSVSYRGLITQAATVASWIKKSSSAFGSL